MATLDQVCDAVKIAVEAVLFNLGSTVPPYQVGIGFPFAPALSEILGEGESQVSIYPLTKSSQNRTSRHPKWITYSTSTPTMSVAISKSGSSWALTFNGTPGAGFNIHTFFDNSAYDAFYQTLSTDTLITIATAVKNAINSLSIPGVSASSLNNVVTVTGTSFVKCNIGGTCIMVQEVRRTMTPIQVSLWTPSAAVRATMGAALENGLALDFPIPFLQAADGAAIWIRMRGAPDWKQDKSQRAYSLYEWHGVYECEYPTLQTTTGTGIESVGTQVGTNATTYTGGP